MESGGVRILAVEGQELNADTAAHLAKLFNGIADDPAKAKQACSSFVLQFPDFESDRRPIYTIPEVRDFIHTLDRDCPYAAYFLHGDPSMSHIQFYLLCLVDLQKNEKGWLYDVRDLVALAIHRYNAIAALCRRIGEDENRGTDGLLMNLPAEALAGNPEVANKALRAMKPVLEALKREFDDLNFRPDGRALIRDIIGRAAILSGFGTVNKPDKAMLDKILNKLR